jgi:nucleoside-diphosphate-sugar epimerase
MQVVGGGFLARHLAAIAHAHPGVVVVAAGVSSTQTVAEADYRRDACLVYDTIRECREKDRVLVYLSTASDNLYRGGGSGGREDEPVYPLSAYGRHKLLLETTIRQSGVRHLILRLGYVVGPHQPEHQLVRFLTVAIRSGTVKIFRGACRDLIDVSDVVTIIDRLLATGVTGQVVNVASGISVPVHRIVDRLEFRLGVLAQRQYVGDHVPYSVSIEKLRQLVPTVADLGFDPDYYLRVIDRNVTQITPALAGSAEWAEAASGLPAPGSAGSAV